MYIQQYFNYGEMTSAHLDPQGSNLDDTSLAWLYSQLLITPLAHWEEDANFYWDPHEISLHESQLVRFHAKIDKGNALLTENASLRSVMAEGRIKMIHQMSSEPPTDWHLHHHKNSLPYQGIVGCLGEPKRFLFHVIACSPAEAWQKVTSQMENAGIPSRLLTLHSLALSSMPHSLMRNRHQPSDGSKLLDIHAIKKALEPHRDALHDIVKKTESLDNRYEDPLERAFHIGRTVAEYLGDGALHAKQWVLSGLAASATYDDDSSDEADKALSHEVIIMDEDGNPRETWSNMFAFTQHEHEALTIEPTIRFLVMHNIPVNTPLNIQEQQAWCDYYLNQCA